MSINQPPSDIKSQLFLTKFNGTSWTPEVAITDIGHEDWTPSIAVDNADHPHVVWERNYSIAYISYDGSQWSTPFIVSQETLAAFNPRIAIDRDNHIHIVWDTEGVPGGSVWYKSYDGQSWSTTYRVSDTLIDAAFPAIAVDSSDNIHIAMAGQVPPIYRMVIYSRSCVGGVWTGISTLTGDSAESRSPDIALPPGGDPTIIWSERSFATELPYRIRVFESALEGSGWGASRPIADTSESYTPRIGFDKYGNIHVAWELYYRNTMRQAIMYGCFTGASWDRPIDISSPVVAYGMPALTVDPEGGCHVVWISYDHFRLYYRYRPALANAIENQHPLVEALRLNSNYPNPFNGLTTISYHLPVATEVDLSVYDVLGRKVATLVKERRVKGDHTVVFDPKDLPSGTYFCRLRVNAQTRTIKTLLLR
jgi:hypothetical protein